SGSTPFRSGRCRRVNRNYTGGVEAGAGTSSVRNKDGRRDLSLIRASGSTARVLNLALVHERHGHTEEHKARPFFRNPRLNRALIIKHVLRAHERDLFTRPAACVTKVTLPYASSE